MQILIDIPNKKYDKLIKQMQLDRNFRACKISLLPKGHGDLIDRKELLKQSYRIDDSATLSTRNVVNEEEIDDAPTIIEADKEDKE